MTANPFTVSPSASVEDVLTIMSREQVRRLCVTESGRLVGMLSLGDIVDRMPDDPQISHTLSDISQPVRRGQPAAVG
jgi:CBS domain-containing protein